ncbi:AcrR family transcriptional regulator [Sphingopyxis panaciterrae]|uniref:TetR/AcrR family transcriptional regulator n=1 Tax=Sphingopyxis panaciterrae TaxID=363841 RepID=UPI00141DA89C|nr:TetR/AcrR family transcriptional regulator [Sphingopyxis panaciterrae]NIJ38795.1 AcrR family transcriptional regulator [Sphingopyxis panaciterrae]
MPKRDAAYMAGQRDLIAHAAFECLIDKGVADTSIRDICAKAGISIGAFYTHFPDRQQAIFAACEDDLGSIVGWEPSSSWHEYSNAFVRAWNDLAAPGSRARKRLRLNFQFVGELALYEGEFPDLAEVNAKYFAGMRESLERIRARGEIDLPLGLERTVQLHARLYHGSAHVLMLRAERDTSALLDDLLAGIAAVAGYKASAP